MNRWEFLGAGLLTLSLSKRLMFRQTPDDDVIDPSTQTQGQALRVLLGRGAAQRIDDTAFLFEGRRYRGTFSNSASGVVNTVPLEEYLYSVVSREMPHTWPGAALQVQAIVARTYVLQRSNPRREYDLVPSEADQVYTGIDAEHPDSSAAVDATAGQVLRFRNGFAQALYSSCCGGHTESNGEAWGGAAIAYLQGVQCGHCTDSPWYNWKQDVALPRISQALSLQLQPIGDLTALSLDPPDPSGRAQYWTFTGATGTQRVKAADIRRALGTRVLPSLLVRTLTFAQADQRVTIEGGGLGHGVGLCQWGARGMALGGAAARDIIAYYYPGTGIGND